MEPLGGDEVRLVLRRMGGVVRGDGVQSPVRQAFQQSLPVRLISQGRVHPEIRVHALHGLVGKEQVVGAGLGGNGHAPGLGLPNEGHGPPGAYMADVHPGP